MATTLPKAVHGEFLLCGLCDDTLQRPKILPCNHTYCQGCLHRHVQRSTTTRATLWFLCPTCRAITDIPPQGVAAFRTNHFILGLKRIIASSSRRRNSPDRKCDQKNLADQASGFNSASHNSNRHSAGSSESDSEGPSGGGSNSPRPTLRCHGGTVVTCDCKQEEVRFFCVICDKMICGGCMATAHKTHNVLRLEDHANKEKDLALSTTHASRKDITDLNEAVSDLDKYKKSLRKSRDEARLGVKNQAQFLRSVINEFESTMLKEIDSVFTDETSNADKLTKHYKEMMTLMKNFTDFSGKLLNDASHSEIIAWRKHLELQYKDINSGIKMSGVDLIKRQPVYIRHIVTEDDSMENYCKNTTKKLLGKVQYGRSLEVIDLNMNRGQGTTHVESHVNAGPPTPSTELKPIVGCDKVLTTRIHEGRLVRSFSAFTDNSRCEPSISGLAVLADGSIVVVDKGNKCVKFFTPSGGMPCKITGSESLRDVAALPDGHVVVTDRTVHEFDAKGRQVKVLRQQPRDSHGVCLTSSGDVVVSDCSSRCIYTLAAAGGTIKRILTLHGGKPFRSPRYVTVSADDDVIVSDAADNLVVLFNDSGQVVAEYGGGEGGCGPGQLNCPCGVSVDRLGNILVCDQNNDRIVLLDSACNFLCYVVEGCDNVERPTAIDVDGSGQMVVAQEDGRIKVFTYQKPQ